MLEQAVKGTAEQPAPGHYFRRMKCHPLGHSLQFKYKDLYAVLCTQQEDYTGLGTKRPCFCHSPEPTGKRIGVSHLHKSGLCRAKCPGSQETLQSGKVPPGTQASCAKVPTAGRGVALLVALMEEEGLLFHTADRKNVFSTQVQYPQPEKGIMINDSDTTRWPLRLANVLAEKWRNLEWIVEEGVLIAALSPAAVVETTICPTNLLPLNFPQKRPFRLRVAAPICI